MTALRDDALMTCPFCGGRPEIAYGQHNFHDVDIECQPCGYSIHRDVDDGADEQATRNLIEATKAWNRRDFASRSGKAAATPAVMVSGLGTAKPEAVAAPLADAAGAARDADEYLIKELPLLLNYDGNDRRYIQTRLQNAADRIAALVAERDAALRSRDEWSVTAERLLLEKQDAEVEVARLSADEKPVAWAVISYLDDDEITALEIEEPEMVVGYARPLYYRPAAPSAEPTEEMMRVGSLVLQDYERREREENTVDAQSLGAARDCYKAMLAAHKGE